MAQDIHARQGLGKRLAAARKLRDLTIEQAADQLTARGFPIGKQGVGHWETGRNVPDAIWLGRLAKLYQVSADALLWDTALSNDALQLAAQYDGLNEREQARVRTLWMAFVQSAADDATVEARMPVTRGVKSGH